MIKPPTDLDQLLNILHIQLITTLKKLQQKAENPD